MGAERRAKKALVMFVGGERSRMDKVLLSTSFPGQRSEKGHADKRLEESRGAPRGEGRKDSLG